MSCHCTALLLITVILREYRTSECHNWTIRIKHFRDSCNNNIYNSGVTIMLFQETVFTFLAYSILTKSSQRSLEGIRSGYHAGHSSSSTPDLRTLQLSLYGLHLYGLAWWMGFTGKILLTSIYQPGNGLICFFQKGKIKREELKLHTIFLYLRFRH